MGFFTEETISRKRNTFKIPIFPKFPNRAWIHHPSLNLPENATSQEMAYLGKRHTQRRKNAQKRHNPRKRYAVGKRHAPEEMECPRITPRPKKMGAQENATFQGTSRPRKRYAKGKCHFQGKSHGKTTEKRLAVGYCEEKPSQSGCTSLNVPPRSPAAT